MRLTAAIKRRFEKMKFVPKNMKPFELELLHQGYQPITRNGKVVKEITAFSKSHAKDIHFAALHEDGAVTLHTHKGLSFDKSFHKDDLFMCSKRIVRVHIKKYDTVQYSVGCRIFRDCKQGKSHKCTPEGYSCIPIELPEDSQPVPRKASSPGIQIAYIHLRRQPITAYQHDYRKNEEHKHGNIHELERRVNFNCSEDCAYHRSTDWYCMPIELPKELILE